MTNANQTHRISVTQADIQAGVRRDPSSCPLALAASRFFKRDCLVGTETIAMGPNGGGRSFVFSQKVADLIGEFDTYGRMRPFTCVVRLGRE